MKNAYDLFDEEWSQKTGCKLVSVIHGKGIVIISQPGEYVLQYGIADLEANIISPCDFLSYDEVIHHIYGRTDEFNNARKRNLREQEKIKLERARKYRDTLEREEVAKKLGLPSDYNYSSWTEMRLAMEADEYGISKECNWSASVIHQAREIVLARKLGIIDDETFDGLLNEIQNGEYNRDPHEYKGGSILSKLLEIEHEIGNKTMETEREAGIIELNLPPDTSLNEIKIIRLNRALGLNDWVENQIMIHDKFKELTGITYPYDDKSRMKLQASRLGLPYSEEYSYIDLFERIPLARELELPDNASRNDIDEADAKRWVMSRAEGHPIETRLSIYEDMRKKQEKLLIYSFLPGGEKSIPKANSANKYKRKFEPKAETVIQYKRRKKRRE